MDYSNLDKIAPNEPDYAELEEFADPVTEIPELPDDSDNSGAFDTEVSA